MTTTLQIRVDSELRREADRVFNDIGMDIGGAIRLFLRQAVIRRTLPLTPVAPDPFFNAKNQQMIAEAAADYFDGAKHFHVHELLDTPGQD